MRATVVLGILVAACQAQMASATVIQQGAAYSIADSFVDHDGSAGAAGVGSHIHASNTLPVDPEHSTVVAANAAEVGGFFQQEEVRGLVEFDLTGMSSVPSATLSFDVADVLELALNDSAVGGLFGQPMYVGGVDVVAYLGNNEESFDDFQATSIGQIASFQTAGLSANQTLSWDVTELLNQQLQAGSSSLGVRLQIPAGQGLPDGAITFDSFQLAVVPEPSTITLALVALLTLAGGGYAFSRQVCALEGDPGPELLPLCGGSMSDLQRRVVIQKLESLQRSGVCQLRRSQRAAAGPHGPPPASVQGPAVPAPGVASGMPGLRQAGRLAHSPLRGKRRRRARSRNCFCWLSRCGNAPVARSLPPRGLKPCSEWAIPGRVSAFSARLRGRTKTGRVSHSWDVPVSCSTTSSKPARCGARMCIF